jgi:adenosylhomocysteine nucleosidase
MKPRVAIIAALRGELKPLVQGWAEESRDGAHIFRKQLENADCLAIAGGIGRESASRACITALKGGALAGILSVGWAGALSCGMKPGYAFAVNEIIDASTGERYRTSSPAGIPADIHLVTTKRIAGRMEKRQLAESYAASLVDMEAATVARIARIHDIPFYCLKAVSDEANETLPDLNPFLTRSGQMQMGRFVTSVIVRPQYWPALMRMGKNSSTGATVLAKSVKNLLHECTYANDHQRI